MADLGLAGELPCLLTGPVVKIVDGDTLDVQLDGRRVRGH